MCIFGWLGLGFTESVDPNPDTPAAKVPGGYKTVSAVVAGAYQNRHPAPVRRPHGHSRPSYCPASTIHQDLHGNAGGPVKTGGLLRADDWNQVSVLPPQRPSPVPWCRCG
jgi:hypothetical protein